MPTPSSDATARDTLARSSCRGLHMRFRWQPRVPRARADCGGTAWRARHGNVLGFSAARTLPSSDPGWHWRVERDVPSAGDVALSQVVRDPDTCPGPARQLSRNRLEAHAGR
jgi:hypothetical protein